MKKAYRSLSVFVTLILLLCCLSGCQSTDKADSTIYYGDFNQATFEYNDETNETTVVFNAKLTNNTIYSFDSFSLTVTLYNGAVAVRNETLTYECGVKNGDDAIGNFTFTTNGEISAIKYVSWSANYNSFWETYHIWLIVSIFLVALASIIYVIAMIANDLDLSDSCDAVVDFFEEYVAIAFILIIPFGGAIWALATSHWVPVLIVIGAIVSFFVVALSAHLIRYLIEEMSFLDFSWGRTSHFDDGEEDDDDPFDNEIESVGDYIENVDTLMLFTVEQLKEYCRDNSIPGYSRLNKERLAQLIVSFSDKSKTSSPQEKTGTTKKRTDSLEELNSLIGLESVKNQLKRIRATLIKNKGTGELPNLHMCFYGNPGTGKTVVARLIANIFYEVGVLPTNKLIETDRSGLCGHYIGETMPKTHKKVKEAMGGVLFIDEAYMLYANSSEADYGKEAIAALLKDMEDYKGKFCVILAGYKDEMEKMIALNPGFDSRISRKIEFPNYTTDEQLRILDIMLAKKKYEITEEAKSKLVEILEKCSKDKHFANARTVRNILDTLIEIQAVRTMEDNNPSNDDERIIRLEDVEQYQEEND